MVKIKKEVVIDIGPESGLEITDIYRTNADIISAIIGVVSDDDGLLDEFVCENIDNTNYQELYKKVKVLYEAMKKGMKNG